MIAGRCSAWHCCWMICWTCRESPRGRLQLRRQTSNCRLWSRRLSRHRRPLIDAKRHHLQIDLPGQPIELDVDPLRLSQALSNLLTNAAKYTDPAGRIELTATLDSSELEDCRARFRYRAGCAGHPARVRHVFQVDSAVDRTEGGLGIGLALVKGLVNLHGGSVQAASEGPGRGSTFTISLPRASVVTVTVRPTTSAPLDQPAGGARCRVLVADDNVDAAQTLAMILQMSGFEVAVASSGREALEMARRDQPEALILDIGMPELNGYEVARHVRQERWGQEVLLIALTGWGQPDDKEKARAAGFDHHLTKPVDLDMVERLLAAYSQRLTRSAVEQQRGIQPLSSR